MVPARSVFVRGVVIVSVLFWTSTSTATAQSATGEIQGIITDASRLVLPGVTVTITNTATGLTRETITDGSGFFAAPGLPVGPYEVQAARAGLATRRQSGLVLQVGQIITLRLELRVAQAPETITVAGPAPVVETTRSQVGSVIASTEVEQLAVRGHNALTLATIAPVVSAFDRIVWDGYERSQPLGTPRWISQEATYGIQVNTSSYAAEYGRALGGIVNLVTKSGSNELNGSVVGLRGNGGSQFSGSAGGPLARDRHFAYGIYDAVRYTAYDQHLLLAKTDHMLSDRHRVSLRFNSDGSEVGTESDAPIDGSAHGFGAAAMSAIGSTLFNEARVLVGRDRYTTLIPHHATVTRFQFADTLTWLRGEHKLKTGVDVQFDRPYVSDASVFAQDEWRIDELTVNVGIRYDAQTFAQANYHNFGPRLGLAWAPVATLVLRGGYGLLYGRTPWTMVAFADGNNGIDIPRRPVFRFAANYENARVHQASTGFEWEWMPHTALTVNYEIVRGDRLPRATNGQIASIDRSQYHAVTAGMARRFAQGHQYRLSYTLGKIDDTMSGGVGSGRRHRFVGSAIVSSNRIADRFDGVMETLMEDWSLSGVYSAQKGIAPSVWISLDPRIARDIDLKGGTRVTVFWEAFNLLDRPNRSVASDAPFEIGGVQLPGHPLLGPPVTQIDTRTMQIAVRFSF